ncbi:MAG: helix-turn-helix domain-containing protein [Anaplasmataceae bacterium]|nr:helix-turn-helix domain-containing protein [Anaplasmataceae bacterium]
MTRKRPKAKKKRFIPRGTPSLAKRRSEQRTQRTTKKRSSLVAMIEGGLRRTGLSRNEVCRAVGISPSLLSRMLSGKKDRIGQEKLASLGRYLGIPVNPLLIAAGYRIETMPTLTLEGLGMFLGALESHGVQPEHLEAIGDDSDLADTVSKIIIALQA